MKKNVLKYTICAGVGVVFVCLISFMRNIFEMTDRKDIFRTLCDAFTVPGVMFMLFGLLLIIAREGAFDGIAFGLRRAVEMIIPAYRGKHEKYADYKAKKEEKHKLEKQSGVGFMFVVGGVFFIVALVFLALYYNV